MCLYTRKEHALKDDDLQIKLRPYITDLLVNY
jgi:hypothetical protein